MNTRIGWIFLSFVILYGVRSNAQYGGWERLSMHPSEFRGTQLRVQDGIIYLLGDSSTSDYATVPSYFDRLWMFNTTSFEWSSQLTKGDLPKRRDYYCNIIHGGKLYIYGGEATSDAVYYMRDIYSLRLDTFEWTSVEIKSESSPVPRSSMQCEVIGNHMYMYGGIEVFSRIDFWQFSFVTQSWTLIRSNSTNSPDVSMTQAAVYKDNLHIYSGVDSDRFLYQYMWIFQTRSMSWATPISIKAFIARYYSSATVQGDYFYCFGGRLRTGRVVNSVLRINLQNYTTEEYDYPDPEQSNYPIKSPFPRGDAGLVSWDRKLYVLGGFSSSSLSDVWRFDTESNSWDESTLSRYPLGRYNPSVARGDGNKFYIYGGLTELDDSYLLNDLWLYESDRNEWKRILQESSCPSTKFDCAPFSYRGVFAYYNDTLYVIGGDSIEATQIIFRKFNLKSLKWKSVATGSSNALKEVARRSYASSGQIDSRIYIWGGLVDGKNIPSPNVVYFDMESEAGVILPTTNTSPAIRKFLNEFVNHQSMCFMDNLKSEAPSERFEIWCFDPVDNVWQLKGYAPSGLTSYGNMIAMDDILYYYYGSGTQSNNRGELWACNLKTMEWMFISPQTRVFSMISPRATFSDGKGVYSFGGDLIHQSALYYLDFASLWCRGDSKISSEDLVVEDGSRDFSYFPGTQCSWTLEDTSYIQVERIDIGEKAALSIEVDSVCDGRGELNAPQSMIQFGPAASHEGEVIQLPTRKAVIKFDVDSNALPAAGFSFQLFRCQVGFSFEQGSCYCPIGSYINPIGQCVPCIEGSTTYEQDQYRCITIESTTKPKEASELRMSERKQISREVPSTAYGLSGLIDGQLIHFGGVSMLNDEIGPRSSLDLIYVSDLNAVFDWDTHKASGEVPSNRLHACFVPFGRVGVLIGGKSLDTDQHIYILEPSQMLWYRKAQIPDRFYGASCARHNDSILVYGGVGIDDGIVRNTLNSYNPARDSWQSIKIPSTSPRLSFSAAYFHSGHLRLFGGTTGQSESDLLFSLDLENAQWSSKTPRLLECLPCLDEGGLCRFSRQRFAHHLIGQELHVYGGIREGQVLHDVFILNIVTGIVTHRENYALYDIDVPVKQPMPKYGASVLALSDGFLIIGGASSSQTITNDVWRWSGDMRLWADSSTFHKPIHRLEPGYSKSSPFSFVIFGGEMQYVEDLLLNDLWEFNIENRTWTSLFLGSQSQGPAPRAGAIVSCVDDWVFVFGGRVEAGTLDEKLWKFNRADFTWEVLSWESSLSKFQRPFLREGIKYVETETGLMLWGGQIARGIKGTEFYNSFTEADLVRKKIHPGNYTFSTPRRRKDHCMTAVGSKVLLFGGLDPAGTTLSDLWEFNPGQNIWNEKILNDKASLPSLSHHSCTRFHDTFIVLGNEKTQQKGVFMVQPEQSVAIPLLVNDGSHLSWTISKHASLEFDGVLLVFGGIEDNKVTNQVISYRPGFCSYEPKSVQSSSNPSTFDDGSSFGLYLENTDCSWTIPSATHISIQFNIRPKDQITIRDGNMVIISTIQPSTSSLESSTLTFESTTGFNIHFETYGESETSFHPCPNCYGFEVLHAKCPPYSVLDVAQNRCICKPGYQQVNENCISEPLTASDSGSESGLLIPVIAAISAFAIFVIVAGFSIHQRRIRNIQGSNTKLLGLIPPEELKYYELIGAGSFGEVYRGEWRGAEVAIKQTPLKTIDDECLQALQKEITLMVELRHPNIVLYMGACITARSTCLVCEFMVHGSLYDVLHNESMVIPYQQRVAFMLDIAKGMQYLHTAKPPIIHRDLKSHNVLVDERFRLKVSDFGITSIQGSMDDVKQNGSLFWMAPELLRGESSTQASDVYAYAVVLWEIITRDDPYSEFEHAMGILFPVIENQLRPKIPDGTPPSLSSLIKTAWAHEPLQRPAFSEIIKEISSFANVSDSSSHFSFMREMDPLDMPPNGIISIVCTQVSSADTLWDDLPGPMADAVLVHNKLLRNICAKCRGYISQSFGENFVLAFQEVDMAFKFCTWLQSELLDADWPTSILQHPCATDFVQADMRGLQVKMGIHHGSIKSSKDEATNRMHYTGKAASIATRLANSAHGGQILMTDTFYQKLFETGIDTSIQYIVRPLDDLKDGTTLKHTIYEAYCGSMARRAEHINQLARPTMSSIQSQFTAKSSMVDNLPSSVNQIRDQLKIPGFSPQNPTPSSFLSTTKKASVEPTNADKDDADIAPIIIAPPKPWQISYQEIVLEDQPLGSGSYGTVTVGLYKGKRVAVKRMIHQGLHDNYIVGFLSEIVIWRKIEHPNIVAFIGACMSPPNLAIVMDLIEPGSLKDILHDSPLRITSAVKQKIYRGLVSAMSYLHTKNPPILHRDLKPANILVNHQMEPFICDFGFARVRANNRTMTKCGTIAYQAPEVLRGKRYDEKADVYSFGIILWELETKDRPYRDADILVIQSQICHGLRPPLSKGISAEATQLIQRCWNSDPSERPSFQELHTSNQDLETIFIP
eukprot:TRINITY_DN322_c0_g1_i1.p1 TRINITY_DN322_c0_g1~~TRINITY_DN322_c0_g1_i1.p1  ORF type:complete len:2502 (+),score=409.05 TRINITY_DN322_c0_g1_i1:87-7592(+)